MAECPHGGDPHCCPPCQNALGGAARAAVRDVGRSRVFAARHDDTCTGCGFDIKVGEPVRYVADRLHHAECC